MATVRVSAITAPLDAAYADVPGLPRTPRTDAILMMVPARRSFGNLSWRIICLPAYLQPRNTPRILTFQVESKTSNGVSQMGCGSEASGAIPALLTMLSDLLDLEEPQGACCFGPTYLPVQTHLLRAELDP